jgi:hypothetical protein
MRQALVIDAVRTPLGKGKATGSLAAVHQWICSPTRLDDRTATCLSELPTDLPHQMTGQAVITMPKTISAPLEYLPADYGALAEASVTPGPPPQDAPSSPR